MKLFVALLLVVDLACAKKAAPEPPLPDGEVRIAQAVLDRGEARVEVAKVQPLPQSISTGGRIAFDDLRVSHVFSPVTGRVTRVLAQLGQTVHKGSPLASIVSPEVGLAYSDLVKAHADVFSAERDFKRQQALAEAKAAPARDLEASEDGFRKAKAEEARARQRLKTLRAGKIDLVTQEYTLGSSIEGRVISRMINPGMEVQGQYSGGSPIELFTLGSIDSVWLYADVSESDLPALEPGAKISARVVAYPGRVFEGKVEWISASLDPALRTARIRCSLPNQDHALKPEMFANLTIERPAIQRLLVSRAAITRINDQAFVYVEAADKAKDGKLVFERRHLEIPLHDGVPQRSAGPKLENRLDGSARHPEAMQVISGLSAGERILIDLRQPVRAESEDATVSDQQLRQGKIALATAEERDFSEALTVGGRLTFDDLRVAHLFPPVNGRITRVLAAPGDRVRRGDPLALILSSDLGLALSDARKAQADRIQAQHEVERQREMYAVHASAQRDLEAAEGNFRKAKAEEERAQQKTRLFQREQAGSGDEYVLRSPIDGEVISRTANPGTEVQGAYSGSGGVVELFTVGSIDDLWLLGDVYESDLPYLKLGAEVTLQLPDDPSQPAHGGAIFTGRVDWISDTLDPIQRTAKVRCVLKNQRRLLRPEMYQVVNIAAPVRRALTIPRVALLRLGDETAVFVEGGTGKDGQVSFKRRAVLADEQLPGDVVPVLSGLKAGERVAAQGAIFLVGN